MFLFFSLVSGSGSLFPMIFLGVLGLWDLGAFWQRTFRVLVLGLRASRFIVWGVGFDIQRGACLVVTQVKIPQAAAYLRTLSHFSHWRSLLVFCLFPPAIHAERNHPRFMRLDIEDLRDQITSMASPATTAAATATIRSGSGDVASLIALPCSNVLKTEAP